MDGWKVTNDIALFKRYNNQIPQVYPSKNYESDIFDKFMDLLNVHNPKVRLLLKCYIISLFIPNIPKPVFILYGEQGSAKTTVQELIKMLVDPSRMKTLAFPRDLKELVQKLDHNYVAYFDNLSYIREWVSDELCRAVTGSGFSTRELYTNDDDIIRNFMRCIGLNGINLGATKADLLDRSLIIQLERLPKEKRKKIEEIWDRFEKIKPGILGYILDVLIKVLQSKKKGNVIQLNELPRMADFAEYCEIISQCMGYEKNEFLKAYYENIGLQVEEAIEANSVSLAIRNFMINMNEWKGTATQLLTKLDALAETMKINIKSKSWPKAPNLLSRRINEARTNLREIGILIESFSDSSNTRVLTIRKVSPVSSLSPKDQNQTQLFTKTSGDTSGGTTSVSPKNTNPNCPQNSNSGDIGDKDDCLRACGSAVANQQDKINQNNYRLGHSDTWACQLCDWKGDKWFMQKHPCKGIK